MSSFLRLLLRSSQFTLVTSLTSFPAGQWLPSVSPADMLCSQRFIYFKDKVIKNEMGGGRDGRRVTETKTTKQNTNQTKNSHKHTTQNLPPAGSFPSAHNSQGWGRLKLGSRNSIQVSLVDGRNSSNWAIIFWSSKYIGQGADLDVEAGHKPCTHTPDRKCLAPQPAPPQGLP